MSVENKKKIVIWHEYDGKADTILGFLEEIAKEISEKINVDFIFKMMNMVEYKEKLSNIYRTQNGPHMALIPSDLIAFAERGLFSEVPESIFDGYADKKIYKTMSYKGKQYGVPLLGGNNAVIYYNKEILKNVPRDFQELRKMKVEFQKKGITPMAVDMEIPFWFIPFFSAFDGWPIKDENLKLDFDALKKTFEFLRELMQEGIIVHYSSIDPVTNTDSTKSMIGNFIDGKIACMMNGEWICDYLIRSSCKEKLGVCLIPNIKGKQAKVTTSTAGVVFPCNSLESQYKEPIMEFVKYMMSEECQLRLFKEINRIPVNKKVVEEVKRSGSEVIKGILNQLNFSETIPVDLKMKSIWDDIELGIKMLKDESNSIEDIVKVVLHEN
ncbi:MULTISPECIES: extracellular solute-binding protein [Clostridium]|uniref:Extracellular solute-binding protein n=1 Tax=Clostridium cibarium TaxID=2762247 RepID=A0ABR8PUM2_9CLOT|nr:MULTISPECIES: extracellular solute-binding protein [Clostridium]MBD7911878.1 extracellular solute-binding protein [Clostridium cibarium]